MKQKFTFQALIFLSIFTMRAIAQCPEPPLFLNATHASSTGWTFAITIPQPSCDTILGWQVQWRQQGTSTWDEIRQDSLKQVNSTGLWGGRIGASLTTSVKYMWRTRMIMYKPNHKAVYSLWVNGTSFTPEDHGAGYNTPPDELEMYLPGQSDLLTIIGANPEEGWNLPKTYQLQYRPVGTSTWSQITGDAPDPLPGAIAPYLTGLISNTTYEWRIRYKCGPGNNSVWVNGPDFTTAPGSFAKQTQHITRQFFYFKAAQVKQQVEDETLAVAKNNLQTAAYPNPASAILHISIPGKTNNAAIQLKDINGKTVYTNNKTVNAVTDIDVSKLMNGIYILQISNGNNQVIFTQKIIISH